MGSSSCIKLNTIYCQTTIVLNQENEFYKFSIKKKRSLLPYIDEALCLSGPQACKPIKLATIGYVTMCFQMGRI